MHGLWRLGYERFGIDKVLEDVAYKYSKELLGFSCPRFMLYVNDNSKYPVYVATTAKDYANKFIMSLDFLVTTGGRKHAFAHDLRCVLDEDKSIFFVDVLSHVARTPVPTHSYDQNGNIVIENAPAAFEHNIFSFSKRDSMLKADKGGDLSDEMFKYISETCVSICRRKIPADKMYDC